MPMSCPCQHWLSCGRTGYTDPWAVRVVQKKMQGTPYKARRPRSTRLSRRTGPSTGALMKTRSTLGTLGLYTPVLHLALGSWVAVLVIEGWLYRAGGWDGH
jgi:hypothetical protein